MIDRTVNHKQIESNDSKCRRFWTWILQIILWTGVLLLITFHAFTNMQLPSDSKVLIWVLFGILYIIFIVLELCSKTSTYIAHITNSCFIHDYMKKLFQTPIQIAFHLQCYHHELETNSISLAKLEKVNTYSGNKFFEYYS